VLLGTRRTRLWSAQAIRRLTGAGGELERHFLSAPGWRRGSASPRCSRMNLPCRPFGHFRQPNIAHGFD